MFKWQLYTLMHPNEKTTNKANLTLDKLSIVKQYLYQIQSLSGVTQNDFSVLYKTSVVRYLDYVSIPNQPLDQRIIDTQLKPVISALKRRRGYLLPLGADSEIIFREREAWTFAVFSATLLKPCDSQLRPMLAKALLPKSSYDWLARNTVLFKAWIGYLQGQTQASLFSVIIDHTSMPITDTVTTASAQTKTALWNTSAITDTHFTAKNISPAHGIQSAKKQTTPKLFKPSKETQANPCKNNNTPHSNKALSSETPRIKVIDLTTLRLQNEEVKGSDRSTKTTHNQHQPPINTPTIPPMNRDTFFHWLKKQLSQKTMTINQVDSLIHGVVPGVLIRIPETIDAFIRAKVSHTLGSVDAIIQQQQPGLIEMLKKHPQLIKTTHQSRIHTYCLGRWENRHTLSGIVMPSNVLLDHSDPLPINPDLTIDGLEAT